MNKKNHFENTMMDERLISEYKDEIKYEIADNLAIELAPDAVLSMDSPCIVNELGGRPILNLTLAERDLVVTCGEQSQTYSFQVGLE